MFVCVCVLFLFCFILLCCCCCHWCCSLLPLVLATCLLLLISMIWVSTSSHLRVFLLLLLLLLFWLLLFSSSFCLYTYIMIIAIISLSSCCLGWSCCAHASRNGWQRQKHISRLDEKRWCCLGGKWLWSSLYHVILGYSIRHFLRRTRLRVAVATLCGWTELEAAASLRCRAPFRMRGMDHLA